MSFFTPDFIVPINQQMPTNPTKIYNKKLSKNYSSVSTDKNYGFDLVFKNAVKDVLDTDKDYVNKQYLLATGQIDNAADVTIAAAKAQLAVDLLVQMRNSVLTAYNEIIRINV